MCLIRLGQSRTTATRSKDLDERGSIVLMVSLLTCQGTYTQGNTCAFRTMPYGVLHGGGLTLPHLSTASTRFKRRKCAVPHSVLAQ